MSNREDLTRQAEKCLRQGRLDEAIALYQDLAELPPVDWGSVKQLADLLERAGQREGAARQFARWADHLFAEGFHSKAAALYKKVLKLEAYDEHALWQLAEVSVALKLRADARVAYQRVLDIRQRRGDADGVAAARERLAELDNGAPLPPVAATAVPLVYATPEPSPSTPPSTHAPSPPTPAPSAATPDPPATPLDPPVVTAPVESAALEVASILAAPPPVDIRVPDVEPPPETASERLVRLRRVAADAEARQAPEAEAAWMAVLEVDAGDAALRQRLVRSGLDRADLDVAARLASSLDEADASSLALLVELGWRQCRPDAVERLLASRIHAGASAASLQPVFDLLAARDANAVRAALTAAVAIWSHAGYEREAAVAFEEAEARGWLTTALQLRWVDVCVSAGLPGLSPAQAALARGYLGQGRLDEARRVAEEAFVRDGGTGPSRAVLLDVLARQGAEDPHRVLASLLAPPVAPASEEVERIETVIDLDALGTDLDEDAWAFAPSAIESVDRAEPVAIVPPVATPVIASDVARSASAIADFTAGNSALATPAASVSPAASVMPAVPSTPPATPPATSSPASLASFDWADLLGRDVVGGPAPVPVPVEPALEQEAPPDAEMALPPEVIAVDPADAEPVAADPVEAEPVAIEPVAIEDEAGEAAPPTADAARIGDLSEQPFFGNVAPLQPSFSMPPSWLSAGPVPLSDEAVRRRVPGDDFFFTDDATPPRWAAPPLRGAVPVTPLLPATADEPSAEAQPVETPLDVEPVDPVAPVESPVPVGTFAFDAIAAPVLHDHDVADVDVSVAAVPAPDAHEATTLSPDTDEEVDLTRLLEELEQWDPVLPEMPRLAIAPVAVTPPVTPGDPPEAGPVPEEPVVVDAPTALEPVEVPLTADAEPADEMLPEPMTVVSGDAREELEAVFADLQRHGDERTVAEQQLAAGRVFLAAGLASEAARAFERASVEPRTRFEASLALGELHRSRGQLLDAVNWFEQAAMAPVPDAAVKRPVLYDLAESLEALGETDRALGVLLDLLSQVEDYRDARTRLDRLLRVDAGG